MREGKSIMCGPGWRIAEVFGELLLVLRWEQSSVAAVFEDADEKIQLIGVQEGRVIELVVLLVPLCLLQLLHFRFLLLLFFYVIFYLTFALSVWQQSQMGILSD